MTEVRTNKQVEISEIDGRLQEQYQARLQSSMQELRENYEEQMKQNRDEVEILYQNKVSHMCSITWWSFAFQLFVKLIWRVCSRLTIWSSKWISNAVKTALTTKNCCKHAPNSTATIQNCPNLNRPMPIWRWNIYFLLGVIENNFLILCVLFCTFIFVESHCRAGKELGSWA